MNSTGNRPALCLSGLTLDGGWTVVELMHRPPTATGGRFSVGYRVRHQDGRVAYLKALDFSAALQAPDWTRRLEEMTSAYNFERDLLSICRSARMSRVATAIADGSVTVPGYGPVEKVVYIIFELAAGDIRSYRDSFQTFDLAWCLRSLHNTAVGLAQLHRNGIAHQDLKPSNVLSFPQEGSKIADLGRASHREKQSTVDSFRVPGDFGYAPPEQLYGHHLSSEFDRRYAADLYHLGSLIFFHFGSVSATEAMIGNLAKTTGVPSYNSDFRQDQAYWQAAFHDALEELRSDIARFASDLTDDIILLARNLCEPDPSRRGDHTNIRQGYNQYGLDRIISRLDRLAKRAAYGLL